MSPPSSSNGLVSSSCDHYGDMIHSLHHHQPSRRERIVVVVSVRLVLVPLAFVHLLLVVAGHGQIVLDNSPSCHSCCVGATTTEEVHMPFLILRVGRRRLCDEGSG